MSDIISSIVSLLPKPIVNYLKQGNLYNREILYSNIFRDTIEGSKWLKSKNFSLYGGAANYSFMYVLYRILDEVQPKNILELGLGQTTKLTSQYVNYMEGSKVTVIEGDQDWIDVFSENLDLTENIKIVKKDVETFRYNKTDNLRYKDFTKGFSDEKFDFIIIDGPQGFFPDTFEPLDYSRSNIWELIPNNLAEDFIIIIDDYERKGEQNTIKKVHDLLDDENIEYFTLTTLAINQQHIIVSKNYKFVTWY